MYKAGIITKLPSDISKLLCKTELLLLDLLTDLMRSTAKNAPSGAFYAFPSEMFLAKRLNVTRPWVSTCVRKLHNMGLIVITRRRRVRGIWQTNLYRLGLTIKHSLRDATARISAHFNHVKKSKHIVDNNLNSSYRIRKASPFSLQSMGGSFAEVLAKANERLLLMESES